MTSCHRPHLTSAAAVCVQREKKVRQALEAEVSSLHVKCQGLKTACSESKASAEKQTAASAVVVRERDDLAAALSAAKKACADLQAAAAAQQKREQELQSTIQSHTTSSAAGAEQVCVRVCLSLLCDRAPRVLYHNNNRARCLPAAGNGTSTTRRRESPR